MRRYYTTQVVYCNNCTGLVVYGYPLKETAIIHSDKGLWMHTHTHTQNDNMKMAFQLMIDAGLPPPNAKPEGKGIS